MPQPFKHPKTGVYWFRKVIPPKLREAIGKTEWRETLGTKNPIEAKAKYLDVAAKVEALLAQARDGSVSLTHQQQVALVGDWYRRELEAREAEPGDPDHHDIEVSLMGDAEEGGRLYEAIAPDLDALLRAQGLRVDPATRAALG